ncbi:MAG: PD40 domain-containing protein [Planctomycetaceae bacterium]|nr:PD40 domain-containing protein [Planctomycetaceae bacterium]
MRFRGLHLMASLIVPWLIAVSISSLCAQDFVNEQQTRLQKAFAATDADGSDMIEREEYLKRQGAKDILARDFQLFDFDGNEVLSLAEFSCTPGVIHPSLRGPIPDPIEGLRLVALDALEQSFPNWSDNPDREVSAQSFVIDYNASLSPENKRIYSGTLKAMVDQDRDSQVNWEEAVRFVEIQLGVRAPDGTPLRESSGRILFYPRFVWHDADHNNSVSREEYLAKDTSQNKQDNFKQNDLDGDGSITLEESTAPQGNYYEDPILMFRRNDTDLNTLVSREEMQKQLPEHRHPLIPTVYQHFDADQDGAITLAEYRMSPLGNPVCPWWYILTDSDRDRKLVFEDFKYRYYENRLLWRFYFARFDTDGNNALTTDEFPFKTLPPQSLHKMNLATHEIELLYRNESLPFCGSPAVSPDGKYILFDGRGTEGINETRMFLMTFDGKDVRDLGKGLMPNWAPDGERYACSRYENGSSVWMMNAKGKPGKRIDDGWGAQWSPDGKYISYTKVREIWFLNVETGAQQKLLSSNDHDYRYFYWNMAWSPDSSRIAIKCYKQNSSIVDIISFKTTGEDRDLRVHLTTDRNPEADLAWYPDGEHLLITLNSPEHNRHLPYKLSIEEGSEPELLKNIPLDMNYNGVTVSPDGKWAIFATVMEE